MDLGLAELLSHHVEGSDALAPGVSGGEATEAARQLDLKARNDGQGLDLQGESSALSC